MKVGDTARRAYRPVLARKHRHQTLLSATTIVNLQRHFPFGHRSGETSSHNSGAVHESLPSHCLERRTVEPCTPRTQQSCPSSGVAVHKGKVWLRAPRCTGSRSACMYGVVATDDCFLEQGAGWKLQTPPAGDCTRHRKCIAPRLLWINPRCCCLHANSREAPGGPRTQVSGACWAEACARRERGRRPGSQKTHVVVNEEGGGHCQ